MKRKDVLSLSNGARYRVWDGAKLYTVEEAVRAGIRVLPDGSVRRAGADGDPDTSLPAAVALLSSGLYDSSDVEVFAGDTIWDDRAGEGLVVALRDGAWRAFDSSGREKGLLSEILSARKRRLAGDVFQE